MSAEGGSPHTIIEVRSVMDGVRRCRQRRIGRLEVLLLSFMNYNSQPLSEEEVTLALQGRDFMDKVNDMSDGHGIGATTYDVCREREVQKYTPYRKLRMD